MAEYTSDKSTLEPRSEESVNTLSQILRSGSPTAAKKAAASLGRMGDIGADALASQLYDKGEAWKEAAKVLGGMGLAAAPHAKSLAYQLHDKDFNVRQRAADALGLMDQAAVPHVEDLAFCLGDVNGWVRWNAARALRLLGVTGANALVGRLGDTDAMVWKTAAQALERMGNVGANALASQLRHGANSDASRRAEAAIRRMAPIPNIKAQSNWIFDPDADSQRSGGALAQHGPTASPHCAILARHGVGHDERWVRKRAVEALAETGDVGAHALAGQLKVADPWHRRRAAEGLVRCGISALPHLETLTKQVAEKDRNVWTQRVAATGAARIQQICLSGI